MGICSFKSDNCVAISGATSSAEYRLASSSHLFFLAFAVQTGDYPGVTILGKLSL